MTALTQLFSDLVQVETLLWNAVDDRLHSRHGLRVGQYHLLCIIDENETCRVYDLARAVGLTVGAASKAVDRLEAAGWCRRSPNPDDRRSSLLSLTPAGRRMPGKARPTFEAELAARTTGVVADRTLQQLGTTLAALRTALEEHRASPNS